MSEQETLAPWHDDRLGYRELGETFTNLVTSITDTRVISIEAGFGHGKTYFRKNWAQHLRDAGEVVIEIDAMLSDHSGEPVVTFLGAMLEQIERTEKDGLKKAKKVVGKIGGTVLRAGGKALLREGMDELLSGLEDIADDDSINKIINGVGDDLGKVAVGMVCAQMATERARKDLRTQLESLRDLLTEEKEAKRVIVIVDELDRCHPECAIALLEAMKVVFNLDGFVFCLMVNAHALERLADHRFGEHKQGERYLDKFVDMRLRLSQNGDKKASALAALIKSLPEVAVPFASTDEFGKARAVEVAETFVQYGLSMRQLERVVRRLEVVIRIHPNQPIDLPLLVYLALQDLTETNVERLSVGQLEQHATSHGLSRSHLMPQYGEEQLGSLTRFTGGSQQLFEAKRALRNRMRSWYPELFRAEVLDRLSTKADKGDDDWYVILKHLVPDYIPSHIQMLNAALAISADT